MKVLRFINLFVVSLIVWLALTFPFSVHELIMGSVVAAVASLIAMGFVKGKVDIINPVRIIGFLIYLPVFSYQLIKANLQVAYVVLHPFLPINPGIVRVPTKLKRDISRAMLANSITLTPGTLTVQVENDDLCIHCVNVPSKEEDIKKLTTPFEDHIRRISE
ncbi:MAG: Na+/H+ antiporter subunit E [Deltaproteobacteria bacterium]|nr:Na+/H+ antiporter subunit E [Deltaproteobacteria bacterium]